MGHVKWDIAHAIAPLHTNYRVSTATSCTSRPDVASATRGASLPPRGLSLPRPRRRASAGSRAHVSSRPAPADPRAARPRSERTERGSRPGRNEARRCRGRAGRTDRRDGRDDLAELELVEDGRLTWRSARDMGRVSEDTRGCLEAERREENGSRVRAHAPAPSRPTMRRRRCRRAQAEECHVGGFKIWGLSLIEQGPIRDPSRERTSRDGEG